MSVTTISHKEIIVLAIRQLEQQIDECNQRIQMVGKDHPLSERLDEMKAPLLAKQETLKVLYKLETGFAYC